MAFHVSGSHKTGIDVLAPRAVNPLHYRPRKPLAIVVSGLVLAGSLGLAVLPQTAEAVSTPSFNVQTGTANPFNGINIGLASAVALGDLDGDGDLDAVVGEDDGVLNYFENTGSAIAPAYVERTGTANPLSGMSVLYVGSPTLVDIDGDGDLDFIAGELFGTIAYFENTGSATGPAFIARTNTANPFNGIDIGAYSAPALVDMDGDGDLDAIVGENSGTLIAFENTGSVNAPAFIQRSGTDNPLNGIDVGDFSAPTLSDIDDDGDLDAVVGEAGGTLLYYENTGNSTTMAFVARTGSSNPFDAIDVGITSTPKLADVDGDGDLDAVVGEYAGILNYFRNTATVSPARFVERTGTANPFSVMFPPANNVSSLADLDGDGDLDFVLGGGFGTLRYFENTGDVNAATFVEHSGTDNLFDGVDVGLRSAPTLIDIDSDGDIDAIVGERVQPRRYLSSAPAPPTCLMVSMSASTVSPVLLIWMATVTWTL
jgi:hypothetical protein